MTKEQLDNEVMRLWNTGFSTADISKVAGITVGQVAKVLTAYNRSVSSNPNVKSRTTKAELVSRIAGVSGVDRDKLASLEKANHEALELVLTAMKSSVHLRIH